MPFFASCAVAFVSSCAPIARWRFAASSAAPSSVARMSGRKPGQRCGRRPEPEHAGDVPRARHEARDLEEPLLQRRARVVLVAVDHAGLQRRVDLAEGHRRGAGAHQLDRLDVDRRLNGADLEPGELARLGDVARPRDHVAGSRTSRPRRRAACARCLRDNPRPRVRRGHRRCGARGPSRAT